MDKKVLPAGKVANRTAILQLARSKNNEHNETEI